MAIDPGFEIQKKNQENLETDVRTSAKTVRESATVHDNLEQAGISPTYEKAAIFPYAW
jgi:hypothetical protein